MHLFRRRRVLDELDEVVLEHDLARRYGEVAADLEGRHIGLADAEQVASTSPGPARGSPCPARGSRPLDASVLAQHHRIGRGKFEGESAGAAASGGTRRAGGCARRGPPSSRSCARASAR